MTNGIFYEPGSGFLAHNSMSRILVDDKRTAAWVYLQTEVNFLAAANQCKALERWPGSRNHRETGVSIGFHNPGETSAFDVVRRTPETVVKLGLAMELLASGEGYDPSSLVEGYDWGGLGDGTVANVSNLVRIESC